jgi:hydroxymethylpyrimidine pyrophosphatase-like HAD family hydrolase
LKLIVLDIDGVLSQGEAYPFDLLLLKRLARLNQQARQDSTIPAVTLNTGRPSPYVEALMQAIEGWQPALYESGAGLYFPETYQFQTTPLLTLEQKTTLDQIILALDRAVVQTGKAYWQPGKTVCYTLFTHPPVTMTELTAEVAAIVAHHSDDFGVTRAVKALNIHPKHIHKGTGLAWLAQVTGIEADMMGGVGDSSADADFLKLVGQAAAPANATPEVKAVAHYISSASAAAGLHDILDYWGL